MLQESSARAVVYQILDQVLADHRAAPASRCAIFSVVDQLREGPGPVEDLRRAENVSIAIHKLEWAVQRGDMMASDDAIEELRSLAASWLNSRIRSDAGRPE